MASSKKWATIISSIASLIYFLVIVFQIPLFRFPCRTGICKTPIEVTSSQLIASEIFPAAVVKGLLYPGAIAHAIMKNTTLPSYSNLLNVYSFTNVKEASTRSDLEHLEVLAGSYFSLAGALLGLLKAGRLSLFGTLLIIWGIVKEVILRKSAYIYGSTKLFYIYPTMFIALISAFLSIRRDVRKIVRSCKARYVTQPSRIYSKAKHG